MPSRRTFLQRAAGLVAAVAAPLYIPSERLDFGVPRQKIAVPEPTEWLKIIGDPLPLSPEPFLAHGEPRGNCAIQWRAALELANGPQPVTMRMQDSDDGTVWRDVPVTLHNGLYRAEARNARFVRPVVSRGEGVPVTRITLVGARD